MLRETKVAKATTVVFIMFVLALAFAPVKAEAATSCVLTFNSTVFSRTGTGYPQTISWCIFSTTPSSGVDMFFWGTDPAYDWGPPASIGPISAGQTMACDSYTLGPNDKLGYYSRFAVGKLNGVNVCVTNQIDSFVLP